MIGNQWVGLILSHNTHICRFFMVLIEDSPALSSVIPGGCMLSISGAIHTKSPRAQILKPRTTTSD